MYKRKMLLLCCWSQKQHICCMWLDYSFFYLGIFDKHLHSIYCLYIRCGLFSAHQADYQKGSFGNAVNHEILQLQVLSSWPVFTRTMSRTFLLPFALLRPSVLSKSVLNILNIDHIFFSLMLCFTHICSHLP